MKLIKLTLKNFRSHQETVVDPGRLTFIRGWNASGKSSIAEAIEFLFLGRCARTDRAGRGAESMIRHGAQQAEISGILDFGGLALTEVIRQRNKAGSTFMVKTVQTQFAGAHAKLWMENNLPEAVLEACLNAGRFLDLSQDEQAAVLAAALQPDPVKLDQAIFADLQEAGPNELFSPGTHYGKITIASLAQAEAYYEFFYKLRTKVAQDLKTFGQPDEPAVDPNMPSLDQVKADLAVIQRERTHLISQREKLLAKQSHDVAEREEAQNTLIVWKPRILSDEEEKKYLEVRERNEEFERDKGKLYDLTRDIAWAEDAVEKLKMTVVAMCPTCFQAVEEAHKNKLLEEAGLRLATLRTTKAAVEQRLSGLTPGDAETSLRIHREAVAKVTVAEARLKRGVPATDVQDVDTRIEALDARISKGQDVLADVSAANERLANYRIALGTIETLKRRHAALERLVPWFEAVKARLVAGKLGAFIELLNARLARWGFNCQFSLEPYRLLVLTERPLSDTREAVPLFTLRQLSESEAYRFSIAFQVALAEVTGIKFVVIDRADMLDVESRAALVDMLDSSYLEQAIVLSTSYTPNEVPEVIPEGVVFYRLEKPDRVSHLDLVAPVGRKCK